MFYTDHVARARMTIENPRSVSQRKKLLITHLSVATFHLGTYLLLYF